MGIFESRRAGREAGLEIARFADVRMRSLQSGELPVAELPKNSIIAVYLAPRIASAWTHNKPASDNKDRHLLKLSLVDPKNGSFRVIHDSRGLDSSRGHSVPIDAVIRVTDPAYPTETNEIILKQNDPLTICLEDDEVIVSDLVLKQISVNPTVNNGACMFAGELNNWPTE